MKKDELFRKGFLGDDPSVALDSLRDAITNHVIPFLNDWWGSMDQIPTDSEIEQLRKAISERESSSSLAPPFAEIPELLRRLAIAMRMNRRNFINIHPSPFLPSALASFLVAIQNPNNIVPEVSKATTELEHEAINWMARELLGFKEGDAREVWGNVVSGGTVANMTALLVARDYTYDKLNRPRVGHIGGRGVIGSKPGIVIGSTATHYSVEKALWFLGLGSENLIRVPVCYDAALQVPNFREERFVAGIQDPKWKDVIAHAIEEDRARGLLELQKFYSGEQCPFSLQPLASEILKTVYSCFEFDVPLLAYVLTVGTTDTGTVESLAPHILELLKGEDIFIHADAASGGFALVEEEVKRRVPYLGVTDSFTIDPHKMGLLHYPCGAVLFNGLGYRDQLYQEAPYLTDLAPTLEGSRAGSGSTALWIATKTLGSNGYRTAVERLMNFARTLVKELAHNGDFQVLHEVHLNALGIAPIPRNGETRKDINKLVARIHSYFDQPGNEFLLNYDRRLADIKVDNNHGSSESAEGASVVDIETLRIVITNPLVQISDAKLLADRLSEYLIRARADKESTDADRIVDRLHSQKMSDPRFRREMFTQRRHLETV